VQRSVPVNFGSRCASRPCFQAVQQILRLMVGHVLFVGYLPEQGQRCISLVEFILIAVNRMDQVFIHAFGASFCAPHALLVAVCVGVCGFGVEGGKEQVLQDGFVVVA